MYFTSSGGSRGVQLLMDLRPQVGPLKKDVTRAGGWVGGGGVEGRGGGEGAEQLDLN